MADAPRPTKLTLEVVTPDGLLFRDEVDSVQAPGSEGSFGVLPGHIPMLTTLGAGEIIYRQGTETGHILCLFGFCEVLPDRVHIMAESGERADQIDVVRAETAKTSAAERMKRVKDEAGFKEAQEDYVRAVARLAAASHNKGA
ncbi:MAG: F0F1 ATP synthase subunit epsilon [Vicinamibacteria bacterium]|nr:F0F1 ATP synthase subunit epsilon [Vicinamibacteria bacterium]